jgi:H+/Cl- antiporter ClcA
MSNLSWYIILVCILVAIAAGFGGSLMAKFIVKLFGWRKKFSTGRQIVYVFAAAMFMAFFSYWLSPLVLGSGKAIMTGTLFTNEKVVAWYLPFLRFGGTIASFTTGGAGGVFAPALAAGASIGSVMSGWFHFTGSDANILVMAGMVAFLTGITRSPFTSAILVLEMTDRHNVIFQLMVSAMVASLVSLVIDRKSLYDHLKEDYLHEAGHLTKPGKAEPADEY